MKYRHDIDLDYFLEWRPYLWKPVVRWLIQDPTSFAGKRVLDLGCRSGKMSCYFGLLGASVTGVDLQHVDMEAARREALKWNIQERVGFRNYDGNPSSLEENEYDFIFTKSVLVIIPHLSEFLRALTRSMKIGCELIAAENNQTNSFINKAIVVLIGHKWRQSRRFKGVDPSFLSCVEHVFGNVEYKNYYGLVTGVRAIRNK